MTSAPQASKTPGPPNHGEPHMHIDHISIAAPLELLEQVREFYCNILELEVGPRPDFGIAGYWLYGDNHPLIHLIESPNHQRGDAPYQIGRAHV